jgi:hypothetical protein
MAKAPKTTSKRAFLNATRKAGMSTSYGKPSLTPMKAKPLARTRTAKRGK